jgi:hypothetical protein
MDKGLQPLVYNRILLDREIEYGAAPLGTPLYGRSRQIAAAEFHARAEALRARDEPGCYHL